MCKNLANPHQWHLIPRPWWYSDIYIANRKNEKARCVASVPRRILSSELEFFMNVLYLLTVQTVYIKLKKQIEVLDKLVSIFSTKLLNKTSNN